MKPPPDEEELDTAGVDAAIYRQRIAQGRIAKMLEQVGKSMDAEGGRAWEAEVSETEESTEPEAPRPKSEPMEERERRWREQFRLHWPDKPKPK